MQPKVTITIQFDDLDFLIKVMESMNFQQREIRFVLDNYEPEYKELIQRFLNKEVTFAQLKKAVR